MNPTIGCFYGCHYCFTPVIQNKDKAEFFTTVRIKGNFPDKINNKLLQLSYLPQHFKRVQINESNDIYHPIVFHGMRKKFNRDIMMEIYKTFQNHWNNNNKWMIHVLTKSHLILEHLDILKEIKEMVQVEISIASPDENIIRKYERETPSLQKRLQAIEKLSNSGIFVRVMAMPFLGDHADAVKLKQMSLNAGASTFKHKGLNYYSINDLQSTTWDDVLANKLIPTLSRNDIVWDDLILKSGEFVPEGNDWKSVSLVWSDEKNWTELKQVDSNFQPRNVRVTDCGYNILNKEDWGYVV
jgi:DNA repair photolyase